MILETKGRPGLRMDPDVERKVKATIARNYLVQNYEGYQPIAWVKENAYTKTTLQNFDPLLVKDGLKDPKMLELIYQAARAELYVKNASGIASSHFESPPKITIADPKKGTQTTHPTNKGTSKYRG